MTNRRPLLLVGSAIAVLGGASAALAQEPPSLAPVLSCRAIEDDAERLACFDQAVASIAGDESESGERLVVVDLDDAEAIERDGFGLDLPSLPRLSLSILAARGTNDLEPSGPASSDTTASTDGEGEAEGEVAQSRVVERNDDGSIERIELIVADIRTRGPNAVLVEMTNGQVWLISGGRNLDLLPRRVREGTTAVIRRAALGSYLLEFDGRGYPYRVTRQR